MSILVPSTGGNTFSIKELRVTDLPAKTEYFKDEPLDLTGIHIEGGNKGLWTDLTDQCTFSPANGTPLDEWGPQTVTVSYGDVKVTFNVNVVVKIVSWATGSVEDISLMLQASEQGVINLDDYWSIGESRKVRLSAVSGSGITNEDQPKQDVEFVLMHHGGFELTEGGICEYVVGMKDCLKVAGFMNITNRTDGGWRDCSRRQWCIQVFPDALPSDFKSLFRQFKVTTATGKTTANAVTDDYFTLPAEKEVFGSNNVADSTAEASLFQLDYFKIDANKIKKVNGAYARWYERSPSNYSELTYCTVYTDGGAYDAFAGTPHGLSIMGVIGKQKEEQ